MGHICDATCEDKVRLDSAVAALEESSKRLMASFRSGSGSAEEAETAYARFLLAKAQFSLARAICRDYRLETNTAG